MIDEWWCCNKSNDIFTDFLSPTISSTASYSNYQQYSVPLLLVPHCHYHIFIDIDDVTMM